MDLFRNAQFSCMLHAGHIVTDVYLSKNAELSSKSSLNQSFLRRKINHPNKCKLWEKIHGKSKNANAKLSIVDQCETSCTILSS